MLVPGVVLSVKFTVVLIQTTSFAGDAVKLATGLACMFMGPKAPELVPQGLETEIDA